MKANTPTPDHSPPGISQRNGFSESGTERQLRGWINIAAVFTEATAVLLLLNDTGIWYRDGVGLSTGQLAALELTNRQRFPHEWSDCLLQVPGLRVIELLTLEDSLQHVIGIFCLMSPEPHALPAHQHEGLKQVASHLQTIVVADQQQREMRSTPRAPAAASFVPGLVHELRNFVFGISANLDAFDARFAGQEEINRYGSIIRKSLDRLSAFISELKEYGDPQKLSWAERPLEGLIREAIDHLKPLAERNRIVLKFHGEDDLPTIHADEAGLRKTFVHLIGLLVQQEDAGGQVDLHLGTRLQGERVVIYGYLDGTNLKLKEMDLARLFEPFYYRESGLGRLALPVARRVFEAHGGNLTANLGPEGGMRIGFMLPAGMTYPLQTAAQP